MPKHDRDRPVPEREEFDKAFLTELIRAVMLDSFDDGPYRSEDEAVLVCFWKTVNPFGTEGRDSDEETWTYTDPAAAEDPDLPPIPPRLRTVTAHVHPDEPLTPSPDDLLIYDRLDMERGACSHFIIDGFDIEKIR